MFRTRGGVGLGGGGGRGGGASQENKKMTHLPASLALHLLAWVCFETAPSSARSRCRMRVGRVG